MCQAFSALITKSKKVYWKEGVDSHDGLLKLYQKNDKELKDDKEPPNNTFARIEIVPPKKNYLDIKSKWIYQIDERVKPSWLDDSYEKPCRVAQKKWQDKVYKSFDLEQILHPIHPFKIKPPKITQKHLDLLKEWDTVGATVRATVRDTVRATVRDTVGDTVWDTVRVTVGDTVGDTVRDTVWDTVWDTVGATVGATVWDTVWAYIGSMFSIKKWKYCEKVKVKGYPFNSVVKLWKMGLVPSYDGKVWRLHGSPNAKILWEGKI
jgi:hypothetical protein